MGHLWLAQQCAIPYFAVFRQLAQLQQSQSKLFLMKNFVRAALVSVSLFFISSCASIAPPATTPNSVLMVSIDGFRPDYLGKGMTPNLDRIAAQGVRAEWMNPSFPTLTFPNHYTLVTGLRPDRHGIVHNTMSDKELGGFSLGNREAVGNAKWWLGEPIWVAANNAGMPTASMFWPGSEAPIMGQHPTRWNVWDEKVTYETRVDTVVGWMKEPIATRPRFATLYFDKVDKEAHGSGPFSDAAHDEVRKVDKSIGDLFAKLEANGSLSKTDVIIVSDHGMAPVPPTHGVIVDDMVPREWAKAVTLGQVVTFNPLPGFETQAREKLLGKHAHYECWDKSSVPSKYRYGSSPRVPAIVCLMETGWDAVTRDYNARRITAGVTRGSHGFDPASPDMRAIFIATGPGFRNGTVIPAFDNVDVYPLLRQLLGLPAENRDGSPDSLKGALSP